MGYAKIKERWSTEGCRIITIRSVYRKVFMEGDEETGELLTPVEHIFLSVPEEGVDKANEV